MDLPVIEFRGKSWFQEKDFRRKKSIMIFWPRVSQKMPDFNILGIYIALICITKNGY